MRLVLLLILILLGLVSDSFAWKREIVVCESYSNRYNFCPVEIRGEVILMRQLSREPCIRGRTWGVSRYNDGIWVDNGCRAEFYVEYRRKPDFDWPDDGRWGRSRFIICESFGNRYNFCPAPIREGARLVRVFSYSECIRNRTWGVTTKGIWVDRGCRAEFEIY